MIETKENPFILDLAELFDEMGSIEKEADLTRKVDEVTRLVKDHYPKLAATLEKHGNKYDSLKNEYSDLLSKNLKTLGEDLKTFKLGQEKDFGDRVAIILQGYKDLVERIHTVATKDELKAIENRISNLSESLKKDMVGDKKAILKEVSNLAIQIKALKKLYREVKKLAETPKIIKKIIEDGGADPTVLQNGREKGLGRFLNFIGATIQQVGQRVDITIPTGASFTPVHSEVVSFTGSAGSLQHVPLYGQRLYRGNIPQFLTEDYTIVDKDITLVVDAAPGEIFEADYEHA